jgi:hypothetical protein
MGRLTWDVGKDAADSTAPEYDTYDGPKPGRGVYRFELKLLRIKTNRNDDPMLNYLLVMADPNKLKKKYRGYPLWGQQNVTDQGAPYVNQFLNALGLTKPQIKSFWADGCVTDKETPPNVLRLGKTFKIKESGLYVYADIKPDPYEGDQDKMKVAQFVIPKNQPADDKSDAPAASYDAKARRKELKVLALAELQATAKSAGVKGARKIEDPKALIAAILEAEETATPDPF